LHTTHAQLLRNVLVLHPVSGKQNDTRTPESFVQALLDGKRTFTDALVSQIENRLGLPEGTIDSHKA
jgi:hypothetical protein